TALAAADGPGVPTALGLASAWGVRADWAPPELWPPLSDAVRHAPVNSESTKAVAASSPLRRMCRFDIAVPLVGQPTASLWTGPDAAEYAPERTLDGPPRSVRVRPF